MKIAILYICTGKYTVFWKDFFLSSQKYFCSDSEKHYYIFTDSKHLDFIPNIDITEIYQKNLGWPGNTLYRFEMFDSIKQELLKYDYVFFFNANCLFVSTINISVFNNYNLVFVKHPGFYNKTNLEYTYDRNKSSTAYIPFGEGKYYICGGVNGGKSTYYVAMIEQLKENIRIDDCNKIIALWHDESHINHFLCYLTINNIAILDSGYCYPENTILPFEKKILIRDKSKYINISKIKGLNKTYSIFSLSKKILNKLEKIFK